MNMPALDQTYPAPSRPLRRRPLVARRVESYVCTSVSKIDQQRRALNDNLHFIGRERDRRCCFAKLQRGVSHFSFAMAHEWSLAGIGFVNEARTRIKSDARITILIWELSPQLRVTPASPFAKLTTGPIFSS